MRRGTEEGKAGVGEGGGGESNTWKLDPSQKIFAKFKYLPNEEIKLFSLGILESDFTCKFLCIRLNLFVLNL